MSDELSNATRIAALEDYNQRLLAENVRLSNEAAFMRSFINNENVRSDFPTATAMRETLESLRQSIYAACAGTGCLNAHELRQALDRERERVLEWNVLVAQGCTPGGSEFHDCPQNVAYYIKERLADKDRIMKSQQKELNKERERCGVLEREVRAERDMKQKAFTCDWCGTRCNESSCGYCVALRELEAARKATDTRHALDAAKFGA